MNADVLNDIYQTGKNVGILLKLLGLKTNADFERIRENVDRLTNEGRWWCGTIFVLSPNSGTIPLHGITIIN